MKILKIIKRFIKKQDYLIDKECVLEGFNTVGKGSKLYSVYLGLASYVAANTILYNTKIGRFSSIAYGVRTIHGKHLIPNFVSTHPSFFDPENIVNLKLVRDRKMFNTQSKENEDKINIGNDVWIGAYARIMEGVTIGDGAIVGACTLVTKNVPPYAICVGNSQRLLRYRFSDSIIKYLLNLQWWDWPLEKIKSHAAYFDNIEFFCKETNE